MINNGGIVAFPTDTTYRLGAKALNPIAIALMDRIEKAVFKYESIK